MPRTSENFNQRVYRLVRRIPPGRVISYGTVALMIGVPRGARAVGWALSALPAEGEVPWHRVVNSARQLSLRGDGNVSFLQRALLEDEGIVFSDQTIARRFMIYDEVELLPD